VLRRQRCRSDDQAAGIDASRQGRSIRKAKHGLAGSVGGDTEFVVVQRVMMRATEQHQIAQICSAAVQPVHDVVGFQPVPRLASWVVAAALADQKSEELLLGCQALRPSDVENRAPGVM